MKFEDFGFHSGLVAKLKANIESGRIPHAQFFEGEDGSGNLPLAIAYAQAVMSSGNTDMFGNVDGRVSRLNHPDLHLIFPMVQSQDKTCESLVPEFVSFYNKNPYMLYSAWKDEQEVGNKIPIISVHESEQIVKKLSLKSYEGGYKTLVIWQAETMNLECANKLLKLIEEPPTKTLILMVGSDFQQLLPTIQSRTQLIQCPKVKTEELKAFLEKKNVPEVQIGNAIINADGSPGLALQLSTEENDPVVFEDFRDLMRLAYSKDVTKAIGWVDQVTSKGKDHLFKVLDFGVEVYRKANMINFSSESSQSNSTEFGFIKKFAPFIRKENIENLMNAHQRTRYHITRNGNSKIVMLSCTFELMRLIKK